MDKDAMLSFFFGSHEDMSAEESVPSRNEDLVEFQAERENYMNVHESTVLAINLSIENICQEESAGFPGTEDGISQDNSKTNHDSQAATVGRYIENVSIEESVASRRIEGVISTEAELPQGNSINIHKPTVFVFEKSLENVNHEDSAVHLENEVLVTADIDLPQNDAMSSHKSTASFVSIDFTNNLSKGSFGKRNSPQLFDMTIQANSDSSNMPWEHLGDKQEKGEQGYPAAIITTPSFGAEVELLNQEPKALVSMDLRREEKSHATTVLDALSKDTESSDKFWATLNKETHECSGNDESLLVFGDVEVGRVTAEQGTRFEAEMAADNASFGINVPSVNEEDQFTFDCERESKTLVEVSRLKFKPKKRVGNKVGYVAAKFNRGDLVWAKVKSHPWWPGQIFNASDASVVAKRTQKSGRLLVAFFGDGTFGWLKESQLIAFKPNFEQKVKQTTMKSFSRAVAAALDEVCRRSELGLNRSQHNGLLYSKNAFPHANAGIESSVKIDWHRDISTSRDIFTPEKVLEFIKTAACYPFYQQNYSVDYSELCGHAYGVRTFRVNADESNAFNLEITNKANEKPIEDTLKRRFSAVEAVDEAVCAERKDAKKPYLGEKDAALNDKQKKLKRPQLSEDAIKDNLVSSSMMQASCLSAEDIMLVENMLKAHEGLSKEAASSRSKWPIDSQDCVKGECAKELANLGANETSGLITQSDGETYPVAAGYPSQALNKKHEKILKSEKHTRPLFSPGSFVLSTTKLPSVVKTSSSYSQESYKSVSDILPIREFKDSGDVEDIKKYDVSLPEVAKTEPSSGKGRKMPKAEKRTKTLSPSEGDTLRKTKKIKTEIREVNGKAHFMHRQKERDEKGLTNMNHVECSLTNNSTLVQCDFDLGSEASVSSKSIAKKSGYALIDVVQGLQVLARDPLRYASRKSSLQKVIASIFKFRNNVFLKSSGYGITESRAIVNPKAVENAHLVTQSLIAGKPKSRVKDPSCELNVVLHTPKSEKSNMQIPLTTVDLEHQFPIENMGLPSHTQALQTVKDPIAFDGGVTTPCLSPQNSVPCLQELAIAARKKKSEVEQEMATTRNIEQSFQEKLSKIKFADLRHRYKNMKQHHSSKDPADSTYLKMPLRTANVKAADTSLGLFIQFPKTITIPSEAQVNEAFNQFGILENAGIRIYKDNSAAQVIFKLNSDAEAALKYALENRIFGANVSYKLRHFSRSQKHPVFSNTSISNHTICRRGDQGKSLFVENLIQENVNDTCTPPDPVMSHQQTSNESLRSNKVNVETNLPNVTSASTVYVPSCDIKDQMMKLLHEVSLIVSSCSLNPPLLDESLVLDIDGKY